jgi:small GTP-binding protein
MIIESPVFITNIIKDINGFNNIPKWLRQQIWKLLPREKKEVITEPSYSGINYATFKVVVLGDLNPGKSYLTENYLTNFLSLDTKMTIGVDFGTKSWVINGKKVKLHIWDFGSKKRFKSLLPTYVRGASGALFIFNTANSSSLAHIDDWLYILRKEMKSEQDAFPIIVVGIVLESQEDRQISSKVAINIAKSRHVEGYIECNPITGENVEEMFEALTRLMAARAGLIA